MRCRGGTGDHRWGYARVRDVNKVSLAKVRRCGRQPQPPERQEFRQVGGGPMAESRKNGGERTNELSVYPREAVSDTSTHQPDAGDGGRPRAKSDDVLTKGDV